jgi:hypothetical protein
VIYLLGKDLQLFMAIYASDYQKVANTYLKIRIFEKSIAHLRCSTTHADKNQPG